MAQQAKATLSEEVYRRLRAQLLHGELRPGSKLKLGELSARWGVSLSVVREAMTRLAEQGLVRASPQRGFSVTPLSIEDLLDLTRARVLVETLVLREAVEAGDLAWESRVLAARHTLERTPPLTPEGHLSDAIAAAHRDFHDVLLSGCASRHLKSAAMGLRDRAELYRYWSRELAHDDRDLAAEHREIAELAVARNADGAARALARHIERTTAALVDYACRQPAPGEEDTASA